MNKRSVFLYWALLLIPTVLIGVAGTRLLSSERERWDQMERVSALERARGIAQTIRATVEAVEREVTDGLHAIREEALFDRLLSWESEHPGIRNVFIWQPRIGLRYPSAGEQASQEQMRFIARYQSLFAARGSWLPKDSDELTDSSKSTKPDKMQLSPQPTYDRQMQQREPSKSQLGQSLQRGQFGSRANGGWMPWFTDNRLHLLGWVQRDSSGIIVGVELETIALVSQLIEKFPQEETVGIVYALLDDAGRLVHQLGESPIQTGAVPALEVSLTPHLPHWRVAVYLDPQGAALRSGHAFFIMAGLLLATLMVAILLGGVLLTRSAYAHWRDSQQKSSFVSNVSHELKTPLTTIRMYAELINEGIVTEPEKRKHYLEVIIAEAQRLTRLVNNALGFSRIEQGRMTYQTDDFDVVEFILSFLTTNEIRVRESGMSLAWSLPEAPVFVHADRDALEHVCLNVVDNAIKYAADGGSLEVTLSVNGSMCEIRFQDRGPGIPESYREKIFKKFQRVDDSLTAGKVGTGLGLTIARHMMRDIGGNLTYEPRNEKGSCFVVSVPRPLKPSPLAGEGRVREHRGAAPS
jgi:signal transduction histidine kinase